MNSELGPRSISNQSLRRMCCHQRGISAPTLLPLTQFTYICTYIHTYAHTYIHAHYIHTYVKSLVCRERVSLKTYVHMCVHTNIHTGLRVHNCRAASSCAYVHSAIYVGTVCEVISQQALLVQLWDRQSCWYTYSCCVHSLLHTYHPYIHTHIHTCIHT